MVPQFADASELLRILERRPGVYYKATCANVRAVERALADLDAGYGANEISLLVSATESHTQKNLNRTRAEQWQNIAEMVRAAQGRFRLIGTVSVAFGCPFEGKRRSGVRRRTMCSASMRWAWSTSRSATPSARRRRPRSRRIFGRRSRACTPIAHFHDTRGTGLVNYVAAYEAGVR